MMRRRGTDYYQDGGGKHRRSAPTMVYWDDDSALPDDIAAFVVQRPGAAFDGGTDRWPGALRPRSGRRRRRWAECRRREPSEQWWRRRCRAAWSLAAAVIPTASGIPAFPAVFLMSVSHGVSLIHWILLKQIRLKQATNGQKLAMLPSESRRLMVSYLMGWHHSADGSCFRHIVGHVRCITS